LYAELAKAYHTIDKLKEKIVDPFYRLRDKNSNEYMLGKPKAKKPPRVVVTADEIFVIDEAVRRGTCFTSKMDADEILLEF